MQYFSLQRSTLTFFPLSLFDALFQSSPRPLQKLSSSSSSSANNCTVSAQPTTLPHFSTRKGKHYTTQCLVLLNQLEKKRGRLCFCFSFSGKCVLFIYAPTSFYSVIFSGKAVVVVAVLSHWKSAFSEQCVAKKWELDESIVIVHMLFECFVYFTVFSLSLLTSPESAKFVGVRLALPPTWLATLAIFLFSCCLLYRFSLYLSLPFPSLYYSGALFLIEPHMWVMLFCFLMKFSVEEVLKLS